MNDAHHPLDNRLPELLRSGRPLRGLFNGLASPAIVEMVAYAGFDFVIIDNEHGASSFETTEHLLRAARASGLPAMVRCLEHDIARTLDIGAGGLKIPMVADAAHAAALVQRVKYPAAQGSATAGGRRGSAFSTRAAGYGAFGGAAHTSRSDSGIALVVMIETADAAANATAIANVAGVDAVFIGPNDLAHAMGYENRWNEAPVQQVIERALLAISATGKCAGILALTAEEEERYASWGARYFCSTTTGLITKAFKDAANRGDLPQAKLGY
ncbi:MAG: aldolase/citrate lyase family protein [Pseudomonadota bacterium]|nr:aldolase/citrate lyase family protein [Pseudomonadota bacterium]